LVCGITPLSSTVQPPTSDKETQRKTTSTTHQDIGVELANLPSTTIGETSAAFEANVVAPPIPEFAAVFEELKLVAAQNKTLNDQKGRTEKYRNTSYPEVRSKLEMHQRQLVVLAIRALPETQRTRDCECAPLSVKKSITPKDTDKETHTHTHTHRERERERERERHTHTHA
jgi:hypothetical protein